MVVDVEKVDRLPAQNENECVAKLPDLDERNETGLRLKIRVGGNSSAIDCDGAHALCKTEAHAQKM